ncbi:DUF4147 domain-containing protein [Methylosoma difficile]
MTHALPRTSALAIFQAGIAAADPYQAVKHCLSASDDPLEIALDNGKKRAGRWSKIHIIAFGKAACAMAKAAQETIPAHLLAGNSLAITNYENVVTLDNIEVIGASHPLPDANGLQAAQQLAERVTAAQAGELVLVLVSGGGSALIPYPVAGISLADKIATTQLLLASGATINQINCVRKHLSQLKGGGLAKLAAPADCHALILSDVLGDDLSAIASGPTVPDSSTYAEAVAILSEKKLWGQLPGSVQKHLQQGVAGQIAETPKSNDTIFNSTSHTLVGSNGISLKAAAETASRLGFDCRIVSDQLTGIAREQAEWLASTAKNLVANGLARPTALLAGGETTVILKGDGLGGRNQEMALAFALAAEQHGLTGWTFLSGGTDGRDGPTDAAGGLVDTGSLARMVAAGINPQTALANNDSYTALKHSQDLLMTGATGTNVADLQILLLHPHC